MYDLYDCWPNCSGSFLSFQNVIRLFCTLFSSMAVWLFVIFGQLFIIYNKKIAKYLLKIAISNSNQDEKEISRAAWAVLSQFNLLIEVHRRHFYDYRFILIGNILINFILILSCSFTFIKYLKFTWAGIFWEITAIVEFTLRFWLVCHTEDRIRSSVSIYLGALES